MWLLQCRCRFCPWRLPIHWLWITAINSLPKQLTYKTKNRWRSIDAHYQHRAVTVPDSLLPINTADTLIMDNSEQIASQTTYLHNQKSLTLCWRSFQACRCYHVTFSFAYQVGRYVSYGQQQANRFPINSLTRPKIVEAPLTLIFRTSLSPYRCLFCLNRLAIH